MLLRPDNFTPPTRTPWGGERILSHFKPWLASAQTVVGESWEVSVEPSFPSRLAADGRLLSEVIAGDPEGWLGEAVAKRYKRQSPLLVKLLDTADNLSVQVHPAPGDPALASDESGKPESWIVLGAQPGAGIYLGLRQGVRRQDVAQMLSQEGPLYELLNFVPVRNGDVFVIGPGTVHAIGAGVTLVEPQHVEPGKRGLTYRFWDWNRRYDSAGRRDPSGSPRQLHVARSLAVTCWDGPQGEDFVEACRSRPEVLMEEGGARRARLLRTSYFEAERWSGSGEFKAGTEGSMTALTCVAGRAVVRGPEVDVTLTMGHSAVIPARAGVLEVEARECDVFVSRSLA